MKPAKMEVTVQRPAAELTDDQLGDPAGRTRLRRRRRSGFVPSSNPGFESGVPAATRRALFDLRKQVADLNGVVDELTTAIDKLPKGIVKMGVMVGQSGVAIAANVATPVTQTLSFTPLVGRRYRMYCACRASAPNTATPGGAYLRIGGTTASQRTTPGLGSVARISRCGSSASSLVPERRAPTP